MRPIPEGTYIYITITELVPKRPSLISLVLGAKFHNGSICGPSWEDRAFGNVVADARKTRTNTLELLTLPLVVVLQVLQ